MRNQLKVFTLAAAAGLAVSASVANAQIINGDFETGAFAPWTQTGTTNFTAVEAFTVHSGTYAAEFGPTAVGGIDQTVPANAGDPVTVSFWYQAQGASNSFSATLGGTPLVSFTNDTSHTTWTFLTFTVNAPSANPTLEFLFLNPPSYDYLDDVVVVAGPQFACCLPDGSCALSNAPGCALLGGVFHDQLACGQVNCPQPSTGACCMLDGSCSILTQAQCGAIANTIYHDTVACAAAACPQPGACCHADGTCTQLDHLACTAASGIYHGDNSLCGSANCPQPGACCHADGTCTQLDSASCAAVAGIYHGDNTVCASFNCPFTLYTEVGDAGELPATAAVATGPAGGSLTQINGTLGTGDTDMYLISVCSPANFSATTVGGTTMDTVMALFKADGTGVTFDDDDPAGTTLQSRITSQFVSALPSGNYYLAVSRYTRIPTGGLGNIWTDDNSAGHEFRVERQPDPGHESDPITGWSAVATTGGTYSVFLTGTCFPGATCYANCDGSTSNPLLTANDFQCFLNKYAAGDAYANCDGSTANPILTANDFQCFLNKFAVGCS